MIGTRLYEAPADGAKNADGSTSYAPIVNTDRLCYFYEGTDGTYFRFADKTKLDVPPRSAPSIRKDLSGRYGFKEICAFSKKDGTGRPIFLLVNTALLNSCTYAVDGDHKGLKFTFANGADVTWYGLDIDAARRALAGQRLAGPAFPAARGRIPAPPLP